MLINQTGMDGMVNNYDRFSPTTATGSAAPAGATTAVPGSSAAVSTAHGRGSGS